MSTDVVGTARDETPKTPAAWIPDDSDLGARLALVRWRMSWNVKEAAAACGVPAASWRLWELGGAQPRNLMTVAGKIAARTGVDLGWLVGGSVLRSRAVIGQGPTVRYDPPTERPGTRHPVDNRPGTRKPTGRPDPHRTSRVPRQARA